LEYGSWSKAGRCGKRYVRLADNVYSCKEHGMVPKMQGGGHAVPRERRKHLH